MTIPIYNNQQITYNPKTFAYNGYIVPIEFWRPITNEMVPGIRPIYMISSLGNVYNTERQAYSNITIKPGEYVQVSLQTNSGQISIHIHRLVCMAFNGMPPSPNYQVDHKNCDKTCNFYQNLEWVSNAENINRAYENGLLKIGEDNYRAILTNEEIEYICKLLSDYTPIDEICRIMENAIYPRVYPSGFRCLISHILNGTAWRDIASKYNFPEYYNDRLNFNPNEIEFICSCLANGDRYDDIIDKLGKENITLDERKHLRVTIAGIKSGKMYSNISSKYDIVKNKSYVLSNDEIDYICKNIAMSVRPCDILKSMGDRGKIHSVKKAVYDISRGACHIKEVNYYKSLLEKGSTTIA